MMVKPQQSVVITTQWLGMPTGLTIAWTKSIPFQFVLNLHRVTDDLKLVGDRKLNELIRKHV